MYGFTYFSSTACFLTDATKLAVETDTDDEGIPGISLQEMLDDLHITDATGGAGADMIE